MAVFCLIEQKMESTNVIRVSEICGTDLITREAVQHLIASIDFSPCKICNVFELDFVHVDFMSRSFADQLHKERVRLQQQMKCEIVVINANKEIYEMLEAVAKTQNHSKRKQDQVPVHKFSDAKALSDYLLTL